MMAEFWVSSGHLLLDRGPDGLLRVTDDFLKLYLARPELMPPQEACAAEQHLHADLLADPARPVAPAALAAIQDADARDNWAVFLALRDRLLAQPSLEAAYLALIRDGLHQTPPLVFAQLTHVLLRNALHGCDDPFIARAGELFFRTQCLTHRNDTLLLADEETLEPHERARQAVPLMAMLGPPASASLDVLTADNAAGYWARSDAFDMVLDLGGTPSGRDALAGVIRLWLRHMLHLDVAVTPMRRMEDPDWRWFIGLDAEATRIGNALWQGGGAAEDLVALFRLDLPDDAPVLDQARGHPVWLLLGAADGKIRLKPQNLLAGLPLRAAS